VRARPWFNPEEASLDGVCTIRTRDDAARLRQELAARPRRVLVIGSGFIGSEVASVCRELGLEVTVADQFVPAGKRFALKKPTRLCAPAVKNDEPVQSPDGHLLCYQVTPAAGAPAHEKVVGSIHTTTQLGRDRLDTVVEEELCVPSLKVPAV
jgi:hypothetical protein